MGYDPPTHQVWVKIIGLPLQAWTEPEIDAVLQEFGHPIQILPFGRAAGHFRDITTLVHTHNPNRIPRAYTYREGDYSTQIEIVILTCRRWQPGYYPPPDDTATQPNDQLHQQQHNNRPSPHHRASSSSSNDAPSEPTIDLSAWSPRSHQLESSPPPNQNTRALSTLSPIRLLKRIAPDPTFTPPPPNTQTDPFSDKQGSNTHPTALIGNLSYTHKQKQTLATVDPIVQRNLQQIFSLLTFSVVPPPNHVTITLSSHLWKTVHTPQTLSKAPTKPTTYSRCALDYYGGKRGSAVSLSSVDIFKGGTFIAQYTLCPKTNTGLNQPTKHQQPNFNSLPHPFEYSQLTGPIPTSRQTQLFSLTLQLPQMGLQLLPSTDNPHLPYIANLSQNNSTPNELPDPLSINTHLSTISKTQIPTTLESPQPAPQHKAKQKKMSSTPIRRSQRIKERQQPNRITLKDSQPKSKTGNLSFVTTSPLTPMDTSNAIQILKATGLQITQQVDDMIQEAVKQDILIANSEQDMPSTPLHDLVPPLAIPGENLLL